MIIHGAAIHRDEHGKCGLLPTQSFLHVPAGFTTPSTFPLGTAPTIRNEGLIDYFLPSRNKERRGL